MKSILLVLGTIISAATTLVPSAVVAAATWHFVFDGAFDIPWFPGLLLAILVFNTWYWGGYVLGGVVVAMAMDG